ncbi:hypothetical protein [Comamonas composti]|nr:hypothetical protein [Comamonas composti]
MHRFDAESILHPFLNQCMDESLPHPVRSDYLPNCGAFMAV